MMIHSENKTSEILLIAAYILLGAAGVSIFLCMPVVGPVLIANFGFDEKQVGQFSFVQLVFISFGSFLGMWLARHYTMKALAIAAISILLLMDVASSMLEVYSAFLIARALAGTAGGVAVALATGALARLPGTERNFGLFLFTQILLSMLGIWAIPQLADVHGMKGLFYPLVAFEILVLLGAFIYIPAVAFVDADTESSGNTSLEWLCCAFSLLGMLAFFTAIGSYWTYVGLIGADSGISLEDVGWCLSVATIGGAVGALAPIFLRQRVGNIVPIFVAAVLLWMALYATSQQSSTTTFILAAFLFMFGWYTFHPYQMGVLADIDRDGRPVMVSAALTGLGLGLGPMLASSFSGEGYRAVYLVSAVGFLLAIILIGLASLLHLRSGSPAMRLKE